MILILAISIGWFIGGLVLALVIGGLLGFFISRHLFTKYLKEHPPIDEKTVRIMLQQMGRTPSEKQVRQIMASMNQQK